jgi:mono/diheme cytochrome c family protein
MRVVILKARISFQRQFWGTGNCCGMHKKYQWMAAATLLVMGGMAGSAVWAQGAASDAAPSQSASGVAESPQNNMAGWTIPAPVAMPSDPAKAAQILRGEYLVVAGDCLPCHSSPGQPPFAGGNAMPSPVGAVFTPNITGDPTYGIGNYTDEQFWRVLHDGIAPGSSLLVFPHYLLPSMPYDAYSKLSYPDVMAIKAYLLSVPAAHVPNRPGQIPWPFNIRAALLGWRILFFQPQEIQYNPAWDSHVRNGAYLVQALAHCSDCHTPRNLLFASEMDKFLGGGKILSQSWYAPNITSDKTAGVGGWSQADLVQYLHGGGSIGKGAPVGPMQEVVADSLSRLPAADVQDIAAYLQTGVGAQPDVAPPMADAAPASEGATVFAGHCARCHGENGQGVQNNFPNLAGNQAFDGGPPDDLISIILGGFSPWHKYQSNMPAFRATLTDEEIAAVANYVRTSWGNTGGADATAAMVAGERSLAESEITLSPATVTATLDGTALTSISGGFSRTGDMMNCTIDGDLSAASGQHITLDGSCTHDGTELQASATINGQPEEILLHVVSTHNGQLTDGAELYGPMDGQSPRFVAHISYVTPND